MINTNIIISSGIYVIPRNWIRNVVCIISRFGFLREWLHNERTSFTCLGELDVIFLTNKKLLWGIYNNTPDINLSDVNKDGWNTKKLL